MFLFLYLGVVSILLSMKEMNANYTDGTILIRFLILAIFEWVKSINQTFDISDDKFIKIKQFVFAFL